LEIAASAGLLGLLGGMLLLLAVIVALRRIQSDPARGIFSGLATSELTACLLDPSFSTILGGTILGVSLGFIFAMAKGERQDFNKNLCLLKTLAGVGIPLIGFFGLAPALFLHREATEAARIRAGEKTWDPEISMSILMNMGRQFQSSGMITVPLIESLADRFGWNGDMQFVRAIAAEINGDMPRAMAGNIEILRRNPLFVDGYLRIDRISKENPSLTHLISAKWNGRKRLFLGDHGVRPNPIQKAPDGIEAAMDASIVCAWNYQTGTWSAANDTLADKVVSVYGDIPDVANLYSQIALGEPRVGPWFQEHASIFRKGLSDSEGAVEFLEKCEDREVLHAWNVVSALWPDIALTCREGRNLPSGDRLPIAIARLWGRYRIATLTRD
jgi:hypothetical protein